MEYKKNVILLPSQPIILADYFISKGTPKAWESVWEEEVAEEPGVEKEGLAEDFKMGHEGLL